MISSLPEPLLCHILSFLTTDQAVRTCVLSSRWRHLWEWVPRLELDSSDFPNNKACIEYIDKFLALQGKPYVREFKLTIDHNLFDSEAPLYQFQPCLGRVDMRKLERFQVENKFKLDTVCYIATPLTLSVCEALVCLKLHFIRLNEFVSLSLPCLKIMFLEYVVLPSDTAVEALISSSPVLEVLKICPGKYFAVALRVRSQSLKSLTLKGVNNFRRRWVVIDAPKLEYLSLVDDYELESFEIISMAESVRADLDFECVMTSDYDSDMKLYDLLNSFSRVRDVTMSWRTLQFIYCIHHKYPLPKFHGLTRLRATMCLRLLPLRLPKVLESCPSLKHLTLELFLDYPLPRLSEFSSVLPRCLLSSLESVEMESPVTEEANELRLARYFMENSTTLKKLVLRLNQSSFTGEKQHQPGVLEQLIESPRRSSLCQFEVIHVVPTLNHPLLPHGGGYVKYIRF